MNHITDSCSAETPRGEIDHLMNRLNDRIQSVEVDLHRVEERFGKVLFSPPKTDNGTAGAVKSDSAQSALGEHLLQFVRSLERIDIRLNDLVVNCQL